MHTRPSLGTDEATAALMRPLLERGRAAFRLEMEALPERGRPIWGDSLHVVTEQDFATHAMLCIRYVVTSRTPLQILCASGVLCALLEHRPDHW